MRRLFCHPSPSVPAPCSGQQGFTLLEMILSLMLLGMITAMAGIGINQITRGYLQTRANSDTAGKAQLAMLRLIKELTVAETDTISSNSASSITFTAQHGSSTTQTYTVSLTGTNLTLNDGSNNDILVDDVDDFSLAYYDTFDGPATSNWSASSRIIGITLQITGVDGIVSTFSTRIVPRN